MLVAAEDQAEASHEVHYEGRVLIAFNYDRSRSLQIAH